MGEYIIGLDIGGTKCAAVLASVGAKIDIVRKLRFDTCAQKGFQYTFDRLCGGISELMETVSGKCIRAIGVTWGYDTDGELAASGPDAVVNTAAELIELMEAM